MDKNEITGRIAELEPELVRLRHELHSRPELSMHETGTKAFLMEEIRRKTGLEPVDCGHWFYAAVRCGKANAPAIAFRADMDALPINESIELPYASTNPGVSHKCGHDGHSTVLYGLARLLDMAGTDFLKGKDIYLIFQHAEEIGCGARECAALIREKNISRIYGFHNWSGFPEGAIVVKNGPVQCASEGLSCHFSGKPAHASQPEDGISPAQAVSELAIYSRTLLDKMTGDRSPLLLATIVNINVGSKNFGIAASEGEISMTVRSEQESLMTEYEERLITEAGRLAERDGLELNVSRSDVFPETCNAALTSDRVRQAAAALDFKTIELERPIRSSEDFGEYQKQCPGTIFYVGNGDKYPQIHTSEYDFNDRIISTALAMFLELAGQDM